MFGEAYCPRKYLTRWEHKLPKRVPNPLFLHFMLCHVNLISHNSSKNQATPPLVTRPRLLSVAYGLLLLQIVLSLPTKPPSANKSRCFQFASSQTLPLNELDHDTRLGLAPYTIAVDWRGEESEELGCSEVFNSNLDLELGLRPLSYRQYPRIGYTLAGHYKKARRLHP